MSTMIAGGNTPNPRNGTENNESLRPPLDPEALHAYLEWVRAEVDKYERVLLALNVPVKRSAGSPKTDSPKTPQAPKNHPASRRQRTPGQRTPTIADRVEQLLVASGTTPLTLEMLKARLRTQYGIRVTSKNLANILNRWVNRENPRFERTAPNTFARKAA